MRRIALCAALIAAPAFADEPVTRPQDLQRLANYEALLGRTLQEAFALGTDGDIAVLTDALRGTMSGADPTGDWQCRTIKMGGGLPLVVYGNFACRITALPDGSLELAKLTGSQRLVGTIIPNAAGRMIYRGVGYVGETPALLYPDYPADNPDWVEPGQTVPQIGIFDVAGPTAARLMLPAPVLESDFDILFLTR